MNKWTLFGPHPIHGGEGKGGENDIYHISKKIKLGFFGFGLLCLRSKIPQNHRQYLSLVK